MRTILLCTLVPTFIAAALAVLLVGCSSPSTSPPTWGELSADLSQAWCEAAARCGSDVSVDSCTLSASTAACVPDDTCDIELTGDVDSARDLCTIALEDLADGPGDTACATIAAGGWPDLCDAARAFRP